MIQGHNATRSHATSERRDGRIRGAQRQIRVPPHRRRDHRPIFCQWRDNLKLGQTGNETRFRIGTMTLPEKVADLGHA